MNKPYNEYAFPVAAPSFTNEGMTLLDYFAGKAMQAILAHNLNRPDDWVSSKAYAVAEEMLRERERRIKG